VSVPYFAYGTTQAGFAQHRRLAGLLGDPVARGRTAAAHAVVVPRAAACSNPGCELVHRMAVLVDGFAPLCAEGDLFAVGDEALAAVETVAFGIPVHPVSAVTGEGLGGLDPYLAPARTVALLGSSGVGKSTLVNHLAGRELLKTQELRADGRGRHTTSHRELVLLPGGALVLDTPGLRELSLWEAADGLEQTFDDIASLSARCRFGDCAHEREPGCAVRHALAAGTLPRERFESYRKLQREQARLERKLDQRLRAEFGQEIRRQARHRRRAQRPPRRRA
jgi:ribosome biogenesis GTPase